MRQEFATSHKGYLLATAGGVIAAAAVGDAQAADMALKAPAEPYVPAASWAGWYIGLNAGANWQQAANQSLDPKAVGGSPTTSATGFIGGGQIGYNWQDGNFVLGLEGDIQGLTGTGTSLNIAANRTPPSTKQFSNSIRWLSTVRARTGLAVGNTMAYVTGGVAFGGVDNQFIGHVSTISGLSGTKSVSTTRVGWAVGGGIEHILWNSHWTIGLEGMFVDLGTSQVSINNFPANPGDTKTARFSNQTVIGRFKLNYKF